MAVNLIKNIFETTESLSNFTIQLVIQTANEAIAKSGKFMLGVSGGSIVGILSSQLSSNPKVEWSKWKIFLCDERLTTFSNADSTYGQFKTKLIDVEGCNDSWFPINPSLSVDACAEDYEQTMKKHFEGRWPEFDLLLLGMGPDGHTCSLFPGHALLQENDKWIAPIKDSPKPPPERVTMTLPVLNHAHNVAFICAGESKADMLKTVFASAEDISMTPPAARVKPISGKLYWIMDSKAASKL